MSKTIIISRYLEKVEWLNKYKEFKIIIYNKGEGIDEIKTRKNIQIINLPNVGRESHTWLNHIVENYNNLDEDNIFLQGCIDDLGCMAYSDPNFYLDDLNKYGFSVSRFGLLGHNHWSYNVGIEKDPKYSQKWSVNEIGKSELGFRKFAKTIFPEIPYFVATSYGGCFAVKKHLILNHSFDFYKNLLNLLSKHPNPIEGHYMERLWCYMFTKNKRLLKSFRDVLQTKLERLSLKLPKFTIIKPELN